MAVKPAIQVTGIKELRASLKKIDGSLTDIIQVANKKTAAFVVEQAGTRGKGLGRQTAKAAAQLRPGSTAKAGTVRLANTKAVPYAIGMEFGAAHDQPRRMRRKGKGYQGRGWNQLPTRAKDGRFLWPTIRQDRKKIVDIYNLELDRLIRKLGLDKRKL